MAYRCPGKVRDSVVKLDMTDKEPKREVFLSDPVLTEDEVNAVGDAIRSGWITMGDRVQRFEEEFARVHDSDHAIAVASCTAGLHLILAAFGLGADDEVLVPSLTFVATANAVRYTGAIPVLVDIESIHKPHMDPADARARIGPRTRAIIVVHYGGWLCDMKAWRELADDHGLVLIEDAAHAPGLESVGKYGDAAAFSFYGNKNMTTAEGGMVIVHDSGMREGVRRLRSHGMTSLTLDRRAGHAYSYDVTDLGFNYRMDELRAAMGLVQLGKLAGWNEYRRMLLQHYRQRTAGSPDGINIPFVDGDRTTAHLCPALIPADVDRDEAMRTLRGRGIHSSIHYPPVHKFSYYVAAFGEQVLPVTEEFASREISLPIHPGMTIEDVDYVVQELLKLQ